MFHQNYNCRYIFLSSIRRHTKLVSDWSSDVCSSDLVPMAGVAADRALAERLQDWALARLAYFKAPGWVLFVATRSEERRVGKDRIARESTYLLLRNHGGEDSAYRQAHEKVCTIHIDY